MNQKRKQYRNKQNIIKKIKAEQTLKLDGFLTLITTLQETLDAYKKKQSLKNNNRSPRHI